MVSKEQLQRINALVHKAKTEEGLTEEEAREREELRRAYVAAVKENLQAQLDRTVVLTPDGKRRPLKRR